MEFNSRRVECSRNLLNLKSTDTIRINDEIWTYERFQKEILERADAIYTSLESYVIHEFPFPFGRRVPEEVVQEYSERT